MVSHIDWNDLDKVKFLTIGPTLFFGVRFMLYPPTLVKTRLQLQDTSNTHNQRLYRGTYDAFRVIIKEEGMWSLIFCTIEEQNLVYKQVEMLKVF